MLILIPGAVAQAPEVLAHDKPIDEESDEKSDNESDGEGDEGADDDKGQFASDSSVAGNTVTVEFESEVNDADDGTTDPAADGGDHGRHSTQHLPVGAGPVVEQVAWPDFSRALPDCGVMDEVSCYDPESGERFYAWPPAADGDEGPAEDDEESPVVVTGAQLATAVREFVRVQIAPAPLIIQPEQDWHLVNLPVIVRTEPNAQEFSAELLGLPVDIRAEPVSYSWDFGDGSAVLNTTEAGAPYPDETITHSYTEVGEYQITMVAYWSGSFRVGGGPWIEIDGLGVTSSTSPLLDLQARTTRLVG